MRVTAPVPVQLPESGVKFAESAHDLDFRMAERRDPFHKVLYVLTGRAELFRTGVARPALATTGTALLVPSGVKHALIDREPATVLLLCFSPRWLRTLPDGEHLWQSTVRRAGAALPLPGTTRMRIEALWRRALFEQSRAMAGNDAIACASATEVIVRLARAESLAAHQPAGARIRALAAEIAVNLVENWTIDTAAARAAMSRRSFTEHFRAEIGTTFAAHLERLRIDHAAALLRTGEHTMMGVIFSSGFNEPSTFYRAFRRRFGTTPKSWAL